MEHQTDIVLDFRNVGKHFANAEKPAVENFNLEVKQGEFVTFLGPSGSGKSTTLNMLAGFTTPTRGEILLQNRNISELPAHKRNLGMVFQNYALFPHMTVWQNVAFPLEERRVKKAVIKDKVAAILERVGLTGLEDRRPTEISGGQQQRVAFARALIFDPPILLMDEPLGALDKNMRKQLQQEIRDLHRGSGITFLFVTHDQEEAMALSDRIVVFESGNIAQVGTPEQLYREPSNKFVASFLGESEFISGRLRADGDQKVLDGVDGIIDLSDANHLVVDSPEGDEIEVLFRPEDISVSSSPVSAHSWPVKIVDIMYLGAEARITVETASGRTMISRMFAENMPHPAELTSEGYISFDAQKAWRISDPNEGDSLVVDDTMAHPVRGAGSR